MYYLLFEIIYYPFWGDFSCWDVFFGKRLFTFCVSWLFQSLFCLEKDYIVEIGWISSGYDSERITYWCSAWLKKENFKFNFDQISNKFKNCWNLNPNSQTNRNQQTKVKVNWLFSCPQWKNQLTKKIGENYSISISLINLQKISAKNSQLIATKELLQSHSTFIINIACQNKKIHELSRTFSY